MNKETQNDTLTEDLNIRDWLLSEHERTKNSFVDLSFEEGFHTELEALVVWEKRRDQLLTDYAYSFEELKRNITG